MSEEEARRLVLELTATAAGWVRPFGARGEALIALAENLAGRRA